MTHLYTLTDEQAILIADALDIIEPDDAEVREQARALAVQFRESTESGIIARLGTAHCAALGREILSLVSKRLSEK